MYHMSSQFMPHTSWLNLQAWSEVALEADVNLFLVRFEILSQAQPQQFRHPHRHLSIQKLHFRYSKTKSLFESVVGARCRVLKHIPKASRSLAAEKLASLLERLISTPDNIELWSQLFRFGNSCFRVPGERGGKRHLSSLASKVNRAISDFPAISFTKQNKSIPAKARIRTNPSLASCVSAKIEEGDIRGAVRLAISDESFAPQNAETPNALKLLHPPRFSQAATVVQVQNEGAVSAAESRSLGGSEIRTSPRPSVNADASNVPPCLQLTLHDITESIKSFCPGSSSGMDGLSAQHLKDMTSPFTGTHGQRLLLKLLDFANLCLAGSVPTLVRPIVYGAKLFALSKKTGVRPIAVGCTLRRMIAKAAVRVIKEKFKSTLEPIQLGFGVDGGSEAAAHAAGSVHSRTWSRSSSSENRFFKCVQFHQTGRYFGRCSTRNARTVHFCQKLL